MVLDENVSLPTSHRSLSRGTGIVSWGCFFWAVLARMSTFHVTNDVGLKLFGE